MSAFEDWLQVYWDSGASTDYDNSSLDEAFQAGRNYQRELDAGIADYNSEGIDQDGYYIYAIEIEKAIREQKIDD